MNDWISHLETQGLVRAAENEWHFGEAVSQAHVPLSSTAIAPLPQYSIMEIAGPDAERFLQGQTSAQVELANGEFAPLTAFCSPKGRMLANGQLMRVDETRYWLLLDIGVVDPLHAHLAKYAPFYKVEITRPETQIFGVLGENAAAQVEAQLDATPPDTWAMAQSEAAVILHHPGPMPRFMIVAPEATALPLWKAFENIATPVGNAVWRLQDIQAGLAWLGDAQRDSYLPQMINWEALGGISFRKGCYTGQEVVARSHFRGQVKKRLLRAQLESDTLPTLGTPVHDTNGKSQGDVVCAALNADGKAEVLAIITQRDEPRELNIDGVPLKRLALPYAIERVDPESMSLQA
ncbi:CAF17-like 4Fe-4S cluster assembly/insertion protein YgfZ [Chromohalobacter canadensis]|uniref:Folate-binding protein YgfZ n=1 Tax=Chromohalobacter canadensis TaxID=141389 RepID=A0A285VT29_9GAMM|nr:folate-binding protein YgfZ [Chromohalobacter canadensis]MCK0768583.1 folate-binding protein YgfZ [Chromohalobacter canadensis]WQH09088.1 folate-binding protein YgfZ [Chromohalobacter canadensis]SOC57209.1 hypothetical protein SAMN05421509_108175 [Chromohalobacter canadensis]